MSAFEFDAFLSYSTRTEYWLSRRIEAFLEGLHETPGGKRARLRALQICRDGSDVRQRFCAQRADEDAIWARIKVSLEQSKRLIVLCSRESSQAYWVDKEIRWMLEHRGPEAVLLVVASDADPGVAPDQVFAAPIRDHGIQITQLWYDVRAWHGIKAPKRRDATDELVRLALDLLDVNKAEQTQALSIWQRERAKRQTQFAVAICGVATVVLVAAGVAAFGFWKANRSARAAQAASIVRTAQVESDPTIASLLLVEAAELGLPAEALGIGHDLLLKSLPIAVLRGHAQPIIAFAFASTERLTTIDRNGLILTRSADGRGDSASIATNAATITAAFASLDSTKAFLAREDRTVARVELASGTLTSCDVGASIRSVVPSPAGDTVAIIGYEKFVRICSFASMQARVYAFAIDARPVAVWPDESADIWLAVSAHGTAWRLDLTAARVERLNDWSFGPGAPTETFGDVLEAARSTDGRLLAFASETRLALIDARGDQVARSSLELTSGRPSLLKFSPDGITIMLVASGDVQRFTTNPLREIKPLRARRLLYPANRGHWLPRLNFVALAWSPDRRHVATIGGGRGVAVWDIPGGQEPAMYDVNFGTHAVTWAADGRLFATTADDGIAQVWRADKPSRSSLLRIPSRIYSGDIAPAGDVFVVGTSADGLFFGSVDAAQILRHIEYDRLSARCSDTGSLRQVTFVAFNATGSRLWFALDDGTVGRLHVQGANVVKQESICSSARRFAIDRHFGRIAWVDETGQLSMWGVSGSASRVDAIEASVSDLAFSRSGKQLAAGTEDGSVRLWNTNDSKISLVGRWVAHAGEVSCVVPGDRAGTLLSTGQDGKAYWWLAPNHRVPSELSDPQSGKLMERCALSADGRSAFVASSSGRLWSWSTDDPQERTDISTAAGIAQIGYINVLLATSDGSQLITGGALDARLRIWSTQGDFPLLSDQNMEGAVTVAAVSAQRAYLMVAAESGLIRLLPMTAQEIVRLLRERTSATLSETERRRLLGENREQARKKYETSELAQGRTPLPADWYFDVPY